MTTHPAADLPDLDHATWRQTDARPATYEDRHGRVALTIDGRDDVRYAVWIGPGHVSVERTALHRAAFDEARRRADVYAGTATKLADYYSAEEVRVARYEPLGSLAQALRVIADDMDRAD